MRPALVIPLMMISLTASCTAGPLPAAGKAIAVATWTDTLRGGAAIQEAAIDPATGALIELQGAPTDPARPSTSAVRAIDPSTGRQLWNTLTGTDKPTSVMSYKDLLAIATSSASTQPVWVLDARSGTEVRSIDLPSDAQVAGLADGSLITFITFYASSKSYLSAFSPTTGREIWHRSGFGGCPVGGAATDGSVVGVLVNCPGNEISLVGADPATGRELWSQAVNRNFDQKLSDQPASGGPPVTLTANGGLFGVSSTWAISLYTDTGRLVDSESDQPYYPASFTTAGPNALLIYQSLGGDLTVKTINVATRATRTLLHEPYFLDSTAFSNGIAYIDATPPKPLLPTLLIALNEKAGSFSVSALPFTEAAAYYYSLVATSDEVVLISSFPESSFTAAYQYPPPSTSVASRIQGGAPGRWPIACSLVSASAITRIVGGPYVAVPRPTSVEGADPSTCEFVPRQRRLPLVSVSVVWRAPGAAQARQLLRNATIGWTRLAGMRDPAYENSKVYTDEVLMRAGNTIVKIKVPVAEQARGPLLEAVARKIEAGLWLSRQPQTKKNPYLGPIPVRPNLPGPI